MASGVPGTGVVSGVSRTGLVSGVSRTGVVSGRAGIAYWSSGQGIRASMFNFSVYLLGINEAFQFCL